MLLPALCPPSYAPRLARRGQAAPVPRCPRRIAPCAQRSPVRAGDECDSSAASTSAWSPDAWLPAAATAALATLLDAHAAAAEEGLAYDPTEGSEFFKNVAGAAYVALVAFFAFRVLTRRAKKARTEVGGMSLAASPSCSALPPAAPPPPPHPRASRG